jgi:hypothetical protein
MSTVEQLSAQRAMSEIASAERLAERFADACRTNEARHVFADDATVEIKSESGTVRLQGEQVLDAWADVNPGTVNVLRTVPTVRGFVTEHERAVWLCEVRDGRISHAVGWVVRSRDV